MCVRCFSQLSPRAINSLFTVVGRDCIIESVGAKGHDERCSSSRRVRTVRIWRDEGDDALCSVLALRFPFTSLLWNNTDRLSIIFYLFLSTFLSQDHYLIWTTSYLVGILSTSHLIIVWPCGRYYKVQHMFIRFNTWLAHAEHMFDTCLAHVYRTLSYWLIPLLSYP